MVDYTNGSVKNDNDVEVRPWGQYTLLLANIDFKENLISMKILDISPGQKLSVQSHELRGEYWYVLEGEICAYRGAVIESVEKTLATLPRYVLKEGNSIIIPKKHIHSLENLLDTPAKVLELSFGKYDENDIVRYADIYGRVK